MVVRGGQRCVICLSLLGRLPKKAHIVELQGLLLRLRLTAVPSVRQIHECLATGVDEPLANSGEDSTARKMRYNYYFGEVGT